MAGDVTITDRITKQDFDNLVALGVRVKVLLDLSHAKSDKPVHLDIELDFPVGKPEEMAAMLSKFKQKYASTYGKLRLGQFNLVTKKRISAKYEAAAFGGSVVAEATNKFELQKALEAAKAGGKAGMIEVKYR
ncbi:MAG TPA: hypothetical protein VGN88_10140 [Phycisphaerae bacterium]|jgi:hypothetical protein